MPLSSVQYLARISTMQPRWAMCVDCGPFYPACIVLASHAGIFRETCVVVVEQVFVGRGKILAPLKRLVWVVSIVQALTNSCRFWEAGL